jgi:hypothetical protein
MFQSGKRIGLLFIVLNFIVSSFAQTDINACFFNLKSGGILVQLRSNNITLEAIKGKNEKLYNKIIKERDKRNMEIVDAFKSFTYCPVYFFYSDNSKKVFERKFQDILLDVNLDTVRNIPYLNSNYLIATFDATREDTAIFNSYQTFLTHNNETGALERHYRRFNNSMEGGIYALILMSPDFYLMLDPYPHYYRTFERFWIFKRSKIQVVELMQKDISTFNGTYFNFYK